MSEKEDENEKDRGQDHKVIVRNGRAVVKTTVEIDRGIYLQLRDEAIRRKKTIKDIINEAVKEAVVGQDAMAREELETLRQILPHNDLSLQIVGILERTMPRTTSLVVFNEKCKRHGLDPRTLKAKEVPIHFIEDLSLSARFAAGVEAGRLVHSSLMKLIKLVDEERESRDAQDAKDAPKPVNGTKNGGDKKVE